MLLNIVHNPYWDVAGTDVGTAQLQPVLCRSHHPYNKHKPYPAVPVQHKNHMGNAPAEFRIISLHEYNYGASAHHVLHCTDAELTSPG